MTDITDRHTLRRMSWSELFTAAQEAEFQRDYERARIVCHSPYMLQQPRLTKIWP